MDVWTIKSILSWTDAYFSQHRIDSPRLTAEILLAQALGLRRLDLYLQHDRPLEKQELAAFKLLIRRRIAREPVAYITGCKGFFKERFKVAPGVLIPRPDTEVLVETAVKILL
ncbi:MAG: peptide chain release factor N(5)-glutamine methyltransferase, partial [Desulfobacterales bacterium]|nr:peptide chain release factor N(5)-glutamine methyltransferase [Desulfobacterales bacterium]